MGPGRWARCIHPLPSRALAGAIGLTAPSPSAHEGQALTVKDLTAHYGRQDVLHGVALDVPPGMCAAVVGESGSGKTTLARCLIGLHSRWHGEISLGGAPLANSAADRQDEHRRQIQYIFQNPYGSLNPTMTVAENIEEPLRHFERLSSGDRRHRALEILETVALGSDFADRLPGRLSGGERQRVAVGRALIVNPDILICDEITSALDVSVQALLVEQLRDLQLERGLSMVFITHNLAVVRNIAQTVMVLEQGTVVEAGAVDAVLERPQHPYTRQLLEDLPRLEEVEVGAAT